jgi:hypothetical protein
MINKPLGENTGQGIHGFYVSEAVLKWRITVVVHLY